MSFGIGAFPFGFFATNFNFGEERPGPPASGSHQALEEAFLHKVFLWVRMIDIYINKVAVCVFVQNIFLYNCHDSPSLSSNFYHQGKTTNSITYFCVTIIQGLV